MIKNDFIPLIEPYGIETTLKEEIQNTYEPLIEPYGIETCDYRCTF